MILRTVPRVLRPGHQWLKEGSNLISLRVFLKTHGVDIENVYEVEFGARTMKISRYQKDKMGHRFTAGDGEVAREKPLTVSYRAGLGPRKLI